MYICTYTYSQKPCGMILQSHQAPLLDGSLLRMAEEEIEVEGLGFGVWGVSWGRV